MTDHYVHRANGALLPTMKLKRNDDDDCGTEDNGDGDNTDVDVNSNKDVVETVYKPDWTVLSNGNPVITVIGTLELKVSYKRNPGSVSDYVKLAKEMKLVLHQLIHLGVIRPLACGILIEGMPEIDTDGQDNKIFLLFASETYTMDLSYNGVYRFIKLSNADLCLSFRHLPVFPYFFGDMMRLRV